MSEAVLIHIGIIYTHTLTHTQRYKGQMCGSVDSGRESLCLRALVQYKSLDVNTVHMPFFLLNNKNKTANKMSIQNEQDDCAECQSLLNLDSSYESFLRKANRRTRKFTYIPSVLTSACPQ